MTQWSEAWLNAYLAKNLTPSAPPSAVIAFTLPRAIPLLNELLRMHWSKRRKYQQLLSAEIAALVPLALGRPPLERATVTITRYSVGVPDPDAVTPKALLDCLLVRSERHKDGLGIIADDSPDHLTLHVRAVVCATRKEQRTEVRIEPWVDPI